MHVAYWIVAGILTLFYLYSGVLKVARTREQLRPMMHWIETAPMPFVRTIGTIELLGVLGLVLPPLTGIAPGLAVAAATGLALLQVGATTLHVRRGEASQIGLNVGLLVLAVVAAWLATSWV
jgi:hypothetical protein